MTNHNNKINTTNNDYAERLHNIYIKIITGKENSAILLDENESGINEPVYVSVINKNENKSKALLLHIGDYSEKWTQTVLIPEQDFIRNENGTFENVNNAIKCYLKQLKAD